MTKVAIIGMGVVGSGTYETLELNAEKIAVRGLGAVEVKYILDLRDFPDAPFADKLIRDFSIIENDPEVRIVAECIGGTTYAYDYTKRALAAGKHVVTSNKELVAVHGTELLALAEANNLNYMFEAAVGGGAPIIRTLIGSMSANVIEEIYGILNGTTNFILHRMIQNGVSLEAALAEAQRLGYAEQDPAADVEGIDPARKICILANIACGADVGIDNVECEGIMGITLDDVRHADDAGFVIKLLGRYVRLADGKVSVCVAPHLVSRENLLANVDGVLGGVAIRGNVVGEVNIFGAGAGKLPTASAVAADIIDCARHLGEVKDDELWLGTPVETVPASTLGGMFYLRADGSLDDARAVFGNILPLGSTESDVAFITPKLSADDFAAKLDEYSSRVRVLSKIRVLEHGVREW